MTPEEFLNQHELVNELKLRGATQEQLNGCRFWGTNGQHPFDLWSFTWPEDLPPLALGLVKSFCALRWLTLEDPPASRDKDDAWRLVSDTLKSLNDARLEPVIGTGRKFTEGRKVGAVGPVRKKIRDMLKKDSSLDAPKIWEKLKAKPPKGWAVVDKHERRKNSYIEIDQKGSAPKPVTYRTFENYCTLEKGLIDM